MAPKKAGGAPAAKPAAKSAAAKPAAAKSSGKSAGGGESKADAKNSKKQGAAKAKAEKDARMDAMMNPDVTESETEESAAEEEQPKFAPPSRGGDAEAAAPKVSPLVKAQQEKEAEQRMREEAKRRREERLAEQERERAEKAASKKDPMVALLEKIAEKGTAKLSNKERRLYEKHLEKEKEREEEEAKQKELDGASADFKSLAAALEGFSVSLPGDESMQPGAVDLKIECFSISAGGNRLFNDASLTLAKGRHYGLLGPNGQGKTTLLRHLAAKRLPVPDWWSVALVEQEAAATDTAVVDEVIAADSTRHRLLKEEAELLEKLEAFEAGDDEVDDLEKLCQRLVTLGEELEASGAESAEARVRCILTGLGFTADMADGPVSRLSGGWRMRVSLAKALFLEPDLLLLDEPTNHLDLDAVLWLDDYLSKYPKTLLVVSHDADFLDSACTDIVHLENCKLQQYKGGYTEFKKAHALRAKEREKEIKKQQEEKSKGKKTHPDELIERIKDYVVKFHFLPPVRNDEMSGISIHDVNFSYDGKKPWLLKDLNFRVDTSTKVTVVGPNGAGKSTLLYLITKVQEPCEGEVNHTRGLQVGRYSQHFDEIAPALNMTAVEFLTSPELRRFGAGTASPELAHKCLGQFGLPSHAHTRPMKELSGGQKARVCFASITCRKPEILILDEPTNHLDIESVEALIDSLKKYSGGLMLVTHDARLVQATQCDIWVCKGGGEAITKAPSFNEYRRQVLSDLEKRQAAAEAEAKKRAAARKRKRQEMQKRMVK